MREKNAKNMKNLQKFSKNPSFLVFADFHHEGGFRGTFGIHHVKIQVLPVDLSPFWKKSIVVDSLAHFLANIGGFFSFFLVFCKNPPNGWKYGKVIFINLVEFCKTFHQKNFCENPSKIGRDIDFWKNGPFTFADFYYFLWGAFAQILTTPTLGPQKKSFFFVLL